MLTLCSSSPRALPSSRLFPLVAPVVVLLPVAPLPRPVVPTTLLLLRRRKRRRRSQTRTWVSVSSIKRIVNLCFSTKYDPVNLSVITRIMRHEHEHLGGVERAKDGIRNDTAAML